MALEGIPNVCNVGMVTSEIKRNNRKSKFIASSDFLTLCCTVWMGGVKGLVAATLRGGGRMS